MSLYPFAAFKRYEMPSGFSIRLFPLGTGYEFILLEEDCKKLFNHICERPELLKELPIVFDTPETYYTIDFVHEEGFKKVTFSGRNAFFCPQLTFKTLDSLSYIEDIIIWRNY